MKSKKSSLYKLTKDELIERVEEMVKEVNKLYVDQYELDRLAKKVQQLEETVLKNENHFGRVEGSIDATISTLRDEVRFYRNAIMLFGVTADKVEEFKKASEKEALEYDRQQRNNPLGDSPRYGNCKPKWQL